MREIKFRAWDLDRKEMNHKVLVGNLNQGDENYTAHCILIDGEWKNFDEFSNISLMQFTGVQDKNGVDIYEGDMITSHQFLFDGNEVESIIFGVIGSNDFGWTLGRIKNKFYEDYTGYEPSEGETNLGDFYGLHEESFEVIGNIHQNPELLESKK